MLTNACLQLATTYKNKIPKIKFQSFTDRSKCDINKVV